MLSLLQPPDFDGDFLNEPGEGLFDRSRSSAVARGLPRTPIGDRFSLRCEPRVKEELPGDTRKSESREAHDELVFRGSPPTLSALTPSPKSATAARAASCDAPLS